MVQLVCWVLRTADMGDGCQGGRRPKVFVYWRFYKDYKYDSWNFPLHHTEDNPVIPYRWEQT